MHKKYLIERFSMREKSGKLYGVIHDLNEFLYTYENCFKRKESIEALKKIREYIELKEEESTKLHQETKKNEIKLRESCKHEVLINSKDEIYCSICHRRFKANEINFNCIILEGSTRMRCWFADDDIAAIIYEIFLKDENIFDTFENYIKDENVKIYRRNV